MKKNDLNTIPERLQNGLITEKEAIHEICSFVARNYPVYGLHKHDEDFRQDILLNLIERGPHIIQLFNPELGDFFTFLYCYICSLINTNLKKLALESIREKLNVEECINQYEDKVIKYNRIDYKSFDIPKAPLTRKTIKAEELQEVMKELSSNHKDKKLLILAIKSSYYLTDEQIKKICSIYKIKKDSFYTLVQHCKNNMTGKSQRRDKAEKRRNYAYYHHKRYRKLIENLDDDFISTSLKILKQDLVLKEQKHRLNWNRMNNSFERGCLYLRPTNKTVANLMGICERQVNYYINCAKKDKKKENQKKLKNL